MRTHATLALFACLLLPVSSTYADTFGTGANTIEIEFVPIGNPGNPADYSGNPNPVGQVDYFYRMAKYEISRDMINKANDVGGLGITQESSLSFRSDFPTTGITWFEAAKFVNWLNTSEGHSPAYRFDKEGNFQLWQPSDPGYDPENLFRNRRATYVLPSADEWYKAAYYDPIAKVYYQFPTEDGRSPLPGSGTEPNTAVYASGESGPNAGIMEAGGLSPYGTMGQGGNVWEWEETEFDLLNDSPVSDRGIRGGGWAENIFTLNSSFRSLADPATSGIRTGARFATGFRVASIPEPSTLLLGAVAGAGFLLWQGFYAINDRRDR